MFFPPPELSEERDGFRFRGGHAVLDLPGTLAARLKPAPRELLATSGDLGRWFRAAGLSRTTPDANDDDLATALRMREAIYALAAARIAGEAPPSAPRLSLNRMAAGAGATLRLDPDGGLHVSGSAQALLATLAQEAVRLFGGEHAARIRQCESDTCALLFLDTSRVGDRRWCSMSGCGNKAKVAEFRRRKRIEAEGKS